jgi:hypothetical protein
VSTKLRLELDPVELNAIWGRFSNIVAHFAPVDWAQVLITYRVVGDHSELVAMVRRATDGGLSLWDLPAEAKALLDDVRDGMYRRGRGTWFEVTAQVNVDATVDYRFGWDDEPSWDGDGPTLAALLRELEDYPRDESMVPDWMVRRLGRPVVATAGDDVNWTRRAEEALAELGVDGRHAKVGEVADGAWCLVPQDSRWAVFLAVGDERRDEAVFDDLRAAVRYFVGNVYLFRDAFRGELPPDAKRHIDEWPIQPLGGDIKLTLYKGKRLVTLPPGTELDRYGDPSGNTLYTAGTEFPYRSHPAERAEAEYHVYRLRYAVRALTGTAVPWFDQPGGGVAFLLERSVAELLEEGVLEEIPQPTLRPPAPPSS